MDESPYGKRQTPKCCLLEYVTRPCQVCCFFAVLMYALGIHGCGPCQCCHVDRTSKSRETTAEKKPSQPTLARIEVHEMCSFEERV